MVESWWERGAVGRWGEGGGLEGGGVGGVDVGRVVRVGEEEGVVGVDIVDVGGGEVVEFGMADRMLGMLEVVVVVANVLMTNAVDRDVDAGEEINAGDTWKEMFVLMCRWRLPWMSKLNARTAEKSLPTQSNTGQELLKTSNYT